METFFKGQYLCCSWNKNIYFWDYNNKKMQVQSQGYSSAFFHNVDSCDHRTNIYNVWRSTETDQLICVF